MATNGNVNHHDQYAAPAQQTGASTSADNSTEELPPKSQIGWFFVEQYYTTLSKSPDKLHVSPPTGSLDGASALTIPAAVLRQEVPVRLRSRGRGRARLGRQTGE